MIRKLSEELLKKLEQGISEISTQETSPQERIAKSMQLVRQSISRLRGFIVENGFADAADEIHFFKHIKPTFYSFQIYAHEHYQLESRFPYRDGSSQIDYLKEELAYVERYFNQYALQYQYFKFGANDLDELYFLRSSKGESLLVPQMPDLDPEFSTPCDYLFARFLAMEMVKDWILEKLDILVTRPGIAISSLNNIKTDDLKWTGDSVNLAELAYGLWLSKQLNNGTAGIAQIFRWLEEKLNVQIGMPSKRFASIRSRKRLSQTKFLDEMKDAVLHKIDLDDSL